MLVFNYGFEPSNVTWALASLRRRAYTGDHIIVQEFNACGRTNHLYCYERAPTDRELAELQALYRRRTELLTKQLLKDAGERHVRDLLIATDRFRSITQKLRLGTLSARDDRKHALDVIATEITTGTKYGISVKNQREWLSRGNHAIKDVYTKAKAHNVSPWLIIPHATSEAVDRCRSDGIRLSVLGYQVLPVETPDGKKMRLAIAALRPVIGPEPFLLTASRLDKTARNPLSLDRG
jgi:hypothetical protein